MIILPQRSSTCAWWINRSVLYCTFVPKFAYGLHFHPPSWARRQELAFWPMDGLLRGTRLIRCYVCAAVNNCHSGLLRRRI